MRVGEFAFEHRGGFAAGRYAANSRPVAELSSGITSPSFSEAFGRMARLHPVNHGRPLIAPHRDAHREIEPVAQFGQRDPRELHAVDARKPREPKLQREAAKLVAARQRVLRDDAETQKTHQITMRFRRTHAGALGEIAQHHRARLVGQHVEQAKADFDRLDARAQLFLAASLLSSSASGTSSGSARGVVGADRAGAGSWRHERGASSAFKR